MKKNLVNVGNIHILLMLKFIAWLSRWYVENHISVYYGRSILKPGEKLLAVLICAKSFVSLFTLYIVKISWNYFEGHLYGAYWSRMQYFKLWSILELDTSSFTKIRLKDKDLISRKELFLYKLLGSQISSSYFFF